MRRGSGIGDHGIVGLRDFIESHVCNGICGGLALAGIESLQRTLRNVEDVQDEEQMSDN